MDFWVRPVSKSGGKLRQNNKRNANSRKAVGAHRPITRGPGKHEDIEEWHEFVRPQKSGHAECERNLYQEAHAQSIHRNFKGEQKY
jgi:hypothetical protein